jgi:hypothetical protein
MATAREAYLLANLNRDFSVYHMKLPKIIYLFLLLTAFCPFSPPKKRKANGVAWEYQCVDSTRSLYGIQDGKGIKRWFGLAVGDLNQEGYPEILAGKWLYTNPGLSGKRHWLRTIPGDTLDAMGTADVDRDGRVDILAVRCNEQFYLRHSRSGSGWPTAAAGNLAHLQPPDQQSGIYHRSVVQEWSRPLAADRRTRNNSCGASSR